VEMLRVGDCFNHSSDGGPRAAMKEYRVFRVSPNGQISELPAMFSCANDEEAVELARTMTPISSVEIWQGSRFIVSLPRTDFRWVPNSKS
jgi:hypothetical protein